MRLIMASMPMHSYYLSLLNTLPPQFALDIPSVLRYAPRHLSRSPRWRRQQGLAFLGRKPGPILRSYRNSSGEADVVRGSVNIPVARKPRLAAARPGLSGRDRGQRARLSGAAAR